MNNLSDNNLKVYNSLHKLNKPTAENFLICSEKLALKLKQSEINQWAELSHSLASSGWHGWQSANAYMNLVVSFSEYFHSHQLIERGRYGLILGQISQQPPLIYFKGLANQLDKCLFESITLLEDCCSTLQSQYPQASNLLVAYLDAAFLVLDKNNKLAFESWNEIVVNLAVSERKRVQEFIQLSNEYADNNWFFLSSVYQQNPKFCMAYIENYQFFAELIFGKEKDFEQIVIATLNSEGDEWISALVEEELARSEVHLLIRLLEHVTQSCHVTALIGSIKNLPRRSPTKLQEWANVGHRMAEINSLGAIAYFKLESKYSISFLDHSMGWLRFSNNKRVLQLYSQCLSTYPLEISGSDSTEALTEGLSISLPEIISVYDNKEDNFRWLKIALSHQIAYFEFGTYTYNFEESKFPFTAFFRSFDKPFLARILFEILEGARIDWQLEFSFQGLKLDLQKLKQDAAVIEETNPSGQLLSFLLLYSLDKPPQDVVNSNIHGDLSTFISQLKQTSSTVFDTANIVRSCYKIIEENKQEIDAYSSVAYRGRHEWDNTLRLNLVELEIEAKTEEDMEEGLELSMPGLPENAEIENSLRGKLPQSKSQEIMDIPIDGTADSLEEIGSEVSSWRSQAKGQKEKAAVYKYDEWDYQIGDYRNAWCTVYEVETFIMDAQYVEKTKNELSGVANEVKKQLNKLRPELSRKVKGVPEGEDLDLDRAIEVMIDRRSGLSPRENIYVQQQKKQRDVAALFLIDLSASTDDPIENMDAAQSREERKKIIDLEKQAVILMTEGLKNLGDQYAVCGFSGYGRDRVDFVVCKGFDDVHGESVESKIGGLKPMRSTRMGPAIRHAGKLLGSTESKIKALIIISDGYPQDYDYGTDRSDKTYGIRDTTKALLEMSDVGVQSFCLTVDPSGHDYLREMCPEQQYMVIQDINQLPTELSKIYRGLTS